MSALFWYSVLGCFLLAGMAIEFYAFMRAPVGYQDDDGFHRGAEEQTRADSTTPRLS